MESSRSYSSRIDRCPASNPVIGWKRQRLVEIMDLRLLWEKCEFSSGKSCAHFPFKVFLESVCRITFYSKPNQRLRIQKSDAHNLCSGSLAVKPKSK